MDRVRAKLQCVNVDHNETTTTERTFEAVSLSAVYSGDPEDPNYTYSQATPSAGVNMYISNPGAFGFFQKGKQYVIDFMPAE